MSEQRLLSQAVHDLAAELYARRVVGSTVLEDFQLRGAAFDAIYEAEIFEKAWIQERAEQDSLLTEHGYERLIKNEEAA